MRNLQSRALNRTFLHRQFLIRRERAEVLDILERLVGLQAQVPRDPYVGLWARIEGFKQQELAEAMVERRAVRMTLLRGTLHLVTAEDALRIRPLLQPVLERVLHGQSPFGREIEGIDVDELTAFGAALLEERPRTRAQLATPLAERWPGKDGASLAYALTYLLPLVQVTPRGVWGQKGASAFTTVEHWLGRPLEASADPAPLILRYLAAFGPATPADVTAWSGIAGTGELLDRMRSRLRTYRDERGRELFDVEDGRLRDPDTPAPVRFLPEYDNVLLGHADRSRIVAPGTKPLNGVGWGMVLVDGFTAARWRLDPKAGVMNVESLRKLTKVERDEVEEEAGRLAAFLEAPEASIRVAR
jgi:hypothetical protein